LSAARCATRRQASPRFQIRKEPVHLGIAIQARQLFADVVGQELDFGGGDRFGVMHAVLEPVERGALGVVAHDGLRARRFAQGNAAPMTSEQQIALGLRFVELLFEFHERPL